MKSDAVELRRNCDSLREQVANHENVIDNRINSDILPKIGHLDILITDLERETKQSREDNKSLRTDTIELRKNSDYVREQLANYEDVIDKKINTDIMKRIENLDKSVREFEKEVYMLKNSSE